VNEYSYVKANPTRFIDPLGLDEAEPYTILEEFTFWLSLLRGGVAVKNIICPLTEEVQRAMSREELEATRSTGLLRGGREGRHYVSDAVNKDPLRARQRLALPQTPEVRATLRVKRGTFSSSSTVGRRYGMPGGGTERSAQGNVPSTVTNVQDY